MVQIYRRQIIAKGNFAQKGMFRKMKKTVKLILFACFMVLACALILASCDKNKETDGDGDVAVNPDYEKAVSLIDEGNYEDAYALFKQLGDYKDSQKYLDRFHFIPIRACYQSEDDSETTVVFLGSNNLPSKVAYMENGEEDGFDEYTYDAKGNIIQYVYTSPTDNRTVCDYSYDEKGNLIQKIHTSSYGETTYDYMYDTNGNMIKAVESYGEETEVVEVQYKLVYIPFALSEDVQDLLEELGEF